MAINFPAGSSANSPFTASNGATYEWNDLGYWVVVGGSGGGTSVAVHYEGATAPSTSTSNLTDQWYNTDDGRLYTLTENEDGDKVWIDASPSGGSGGSGDGGGIEEAPIDGQQYARQNSNWSVVESGDVIYQGAAAWGKIQADGTIDGSMNIASVTPGAAGHYDIVFTNPMPDANYSVVTATTGGTVSNNAGTAVGQTANGFTIRCYDGTSSSFTNTSFDFAVHALNALPPQGGTGADAWVTSDGTGTIQSSFNVDSVTKVTTGTYEVNFNSPMPNANYAVTVATRGSGNREWGVDDQTVNSYRVYCYKNGALDDVGFSAVVHATNATLPLTITEDQIAALIQNPVLSAWGDVTGLAGANTPATIHKSFNIKSVKTNATSTTSVDVEFETPMNDANYSVVGTVLSDAFSNNFGISNKTAAGFTYYTNNLSDGSGTGPTQRVMFQIASTARNGTLGGGADAWGTVSRPDDATATLAGGLNCTVSATVQPDGTVVAASSGVSFVTFTNPMPNANYSVVGQTTTQGVLNFYVSSKTAQGFRVITQYDLGGVSTPGNRDYQFAVFATDGNAGGFWVREGEGTDEVLKPVNDNATIEASALTDGITTKTMTEVLAGGGGSGGGGDIIYNGAAAWVNANGASGTADADRILGGLNIDTVVRNGAGDYTVTFTNAMPNANYAVNTTIAGAQSRYIRITSKTADSFNVELFNGSNVKTDANFMAAVHALNALPPQGGTGTDAWARCQADGTINGSFNISSVTRDDEGRYTVVFNTAMPNANYSAVATPTSSNARIIATRNQTATQLEVWARDEGGVSQDTPFSLTVNATNATLPATITQDQIAALIQNPVLSAWAAVDVGGIAVNGQGTLAASFNIASCTRTGTGTYDFVFTNPMPSADYSVVFTANTSQSQIALSPAKTANGFSVTCRNNSGNFTNADDLYVQVAGTARNGTLGGGADAWGTFNSGGVLSNSFNTASVTRTSTGLFDVVFAAPMPNSNYSVQASPRGNSDSGSRRFALISNKTQTGFRIVASNESSELSNYDIDYAVFATDGNAGGFWVRTDDELAPINDAIDVNIGGGDITLNADGTAEFSDRITVGDSPLDGDGANAGCMLRSGNGGVVVAVDDGSTCFAGKVAGTVGNTSQIFADGDAIFGAYPNDSGVKINSSGNINIRRDQNTGSDGLAIYSGGVGASDKVFNVTANGDATFAGDVNANNVNFNLEPDNPANFSAEGEYTGPTLDVKERVMNLIARLDALEANELIDDATDTSLLQLVAAASARLDSLESRIAALEGGN